jgi:hypothetical protein
MASIIFTVYGTVCNFMLWSPYALINDNQYIGYIIIESAL